LTRLMDSERALGMPVNLGNPNELTVRQLVDLVVAMTGSDSRIAYRPLPVDDPRRRKPNISRAMELLGWRPTIDLETGLEATIEWFDDEANRVVQPMYIDSPAAAVATAAE
jgi:UDP-glucuronate decarboxylase